MHPDPHPLPPTSASAGGPSAVSATLSLTTSANEVRPNPQKLAHFKQELIHHLALDNCIRIDAKQAIGVLEHGRFESRFARVSQFSFSSGEQPSGKLSSKAKHPTVTQESVGWRAHLLAYDRTAILVSSAAMFAAIRESTLLISLDRMTRAMHSINFFSSDAPGLLFLPVHEGLLLNVRHDHGQYFAALLLSLRINPAKVVIEIPTLFATQTALLSQLVASYHRYGFKVAINLPDGPNLGALPLTSKPEFLLTDVDLDQRLPVSTSQVAAQTAAFAAEQSALISLAQFTRQYGATLVARGPS